MQNLSCENEFYVHQSKNPFQFNSFELSRDLTEQKLFLGQLGNGLRQINASLLGAEY